MAARFWVGGTATWDSTTTTHWSATSGGAGGASVPTSADDVTIDSLSGTPTVTTNYNASVNSVTINAAGATLALGGTLTSTGAITVTSGTFTTNNFAVTASQLSSTGSVARTVNLGSSTVTFTSIGITATTSTNLTFNAGISNIVMNTSSMSIQTGAGLTFYNVSFTYSTSATSHSISGSNTFNNLTVSAPSVAGVSNLTFAANQTINGTLSTSGTAGNRRVWFQSATYGLSYTLTVNSAPSLTDADFRDLQVIGSAAPISGTRIGDLRGNTGITFSTPKTVYWNLAGAQNWSANGWATTSTGTPSTDNFPLAQDTATFTNAGSVTGTITMDAAIPYTGTVDMSARTTAMTLGGTTAYTIYGNWKNGSGTTISVSTVLTFSGRNSQTITSAGISFNSPVTIDSYGGIVQLADALNIGSNGLTITNGTFTTNGYALNAVSLVSNNSNVRAINLGSSTVTLSTNTPVTFTTSTNLTFNAGTSQINCTSAGNTIGGGNQTFYNVSFTSSSPTTNTINGVNTFNNLTYTATTSIGIVNCVFSANQTINGTLTCAGSDAVHRIFLRSSTTGTTRTLTVNSLSANDCDFRDIAITGTASGTSPTRAGDCGGNSGITFPTAKTVYWNLAGAQNWSATGWATSSGGTPALVNFPLAQDTAIFDNTGSAGTVTFDATWNICTVNASARTSVMSLSPSNTNPIYGSWTNGSGIFFSGFGTFVFSGRGTQTITSAGVAFTQGITIDCFTGTVQLADAITISSASALTLTSGTFDAVTYNVTTGSFINTSSTNTILKMGSGTWTLSSTGFVWNMNTTPSLFFKGTANIVLSDTSIAARTFLGQTLSYNKLTIGGTTGTSTLTIQTSSQFTELASTKTVAHTIIFPSSTQTTIGKWSVTGTAGNVVTLAPSTAATAYTISIAGAAPSGIDYLSISYCTLLATSPAEFFVGANSTNTAGNTNVTFTATPSPRTLYWVGGTGNWSSTTKWSTSSGGASGAAIPTSLDSVVFDTLSNATAYTATVDPTQARCAALTIGAPLTGALTFAGTGGLAIAGNTSIAASGVTRAYSGLVTLTGAGSYTLTTNGVILTTNTTEVNGVGCTWTLGSALNLSTGALTITNGTFDTSVSGYAYTGGGITSTLPNSRTINLNSSTVTISTTTVVINTNTLGTQNLTFNAGTSTITSSANNMQISSTGLTFYNISNTGTTSGGIAINAGGNIFNNISISGLTTSGIRTVSITGNQTINGTLTLSAGTDATMRTMVQSSVIGTPVTLTCNAVASLTDIDFRDITIAGNAVSGGNLTGTRLGDCKGNTGITFGGGVNKYWNLAAGGNWSAIGWATTGGGTPAVNNFPLAQDTAIFQSTGLTSGSTVTVNANYNIGNIDMSARTSNTMTLATSSFTPAIYGNWINGTGTTLSGTSAVTFAGRGSQTITNAGATFTQPITIYSPSGSVTLQDAMSLSVSAAAAFNLSAGTFNANNYNVTFTGAASGTQLSLVTTLPRTLALGSGTWTMGGTGAWNSANSGVNLTITGTGTISMTSASAKTFAGTGLSYSGITLNQGGAGTLTISGNNTFANITNTYSGATSIALAGTTQTVGNFTASGTAGNLLTITGTSAAAPATIIYSGAGTVSQDYIVPTFVKAYPTTSTWYAGTHSTNGGTLGYIFSGAPAPTFSSQNFFLLF